MTFNCAYWFLLLAAIIPMQLLVARYGRRLYAKRLHSFIAARLRGLLVRSDSSKKQQRKLILLSAALVLLVTSLARPLLKQREEEVKRAGADFMIALDTSRSMLVRDVAPDHNRLAAAKRVIRELMEQRLAGDRLGIIAFAGDARMVTPMTMNYSTLSLVLDSLNTETIWPGSDVSRAIKVAAAKLRKKELESRVLVIISDGENLQGDPLMAAREAKLQDKLTVFTVGVGTVEGGQIPVEKRDEGGNVIGTEHLEDQEGEAVVSRLDEHALRSLAQASGGTYVHLGKWDRETEGPSALCDLYESTIKPLARSLRVAKVVAHVEVFQVPLGIALLLLFFEMLIFERRKPGARSAAAHNARLRT